MSEKKLWTVAIPNFEGPFGSRRQRKVEERLLTFIQKLDGFVAISPQYPRGILLLFETENNAKGARNLLRAEGVTCGTHICECSVPEEETKRAKE